MRALFLLISMACFAQPHTFTSEDPDVVAKNALKYLMDMKPDIESREYACCIYLKDNKNYFYTEFNVGNGEQVAIPIFSIPENSIYCGSLHNHTMHGSKDPSKADLRTTTLAKKNGKFISLEKSNSYWSYLYKTRTKVFIKFKMRDNFPLSLVPNIPVSFFNFIEKEIH